MSANFATWLRRRHDRLVLTQLDDRQLSDIGITRAEIDRAVNGLIDRIR